jgi:glycosyltransferase involved in cell wall biosynthesis
LTPRVSVVTPTRNRHDMLSGALSSALGQRGVELEVIVVDDGSDPPVSVALVSDPRLRVVHHQSSVGVSAARNTGIEQARAQWIAFLDDDDLWAPDKLSLQLAAAEAADAAWAYGGDVTVDEGLRVISGGPPPTPEQVVADLETYNSVPAGASNVIVRTDALRAVGPFDPSLKTSEDWDMWIRLNRCCGPPASVPRPLVACRMHASNVLPDLRAIVDEPDLLAARYGLSLERAAPLRRAAWACLRAGRRIDAVRYYGQAVALGDIASVARAVAALVHPAARRSAPHGIRQRPNDSWARVAQVWLGAVSSTPAGAEEGN